MANNKHRVALIGKIGCGKTTLRQKLSDEELHYRKTQTINYTEDFIDTPGEFIDMPFFCRNAINVACDAGLLCICIAADDIQNKLPPNFALTFNGPVIGIITKIDKPNSNPDKVIKWLEFAGVSRKKIYRISSYTGEGIPELEQVILQYVDKVGNKRRPAAAAVKPE
ncbi:MAG: EutP/PduV family microcompartment system protein [Eubacteriaceae bacterium]|jgi:ethanolamine utilization protein EutP